MIVARQSTARTVTVGPVLDSSGAAVTTAAVGDFKISKNGGAPAALNASATLTHRNTGHYSLALTASDLDTVGQAEVVIDATTNACPVKELTVVEEAVYDALFAASAVGYVADQPVNATKFGGTTVTGRDIGASVLLSSGTGTGQLKLASGYVAMTWADIAAPTTAVALTGTTIATTQKVDVETIKTQTVTCAAGVTVGAYVGGTGAAALEATAQSILTDTAEIGAAGAGLTDLGGMSTTMKGQVQTEAEDALVVHRLDELLNADSDIDGAAPPTVGSVFHELMTKTTGSFTYDQTTDSLEALRDRGDAAWITATGFSTHSAADVVTAIGTGSTFTAVPWNAAWDAEVQSEVQDAIEANNLDHLLKSAVDTNFATTVHLDSVIGHLADAGTTATFDRTTDALEVLGAATAPSAASIADAVWDETLADHLAGGSTGAGLNSASSAGDPWGTALPGAYSAGSAGHILGNRLVGTIATGTHNPQSGDSYARLGAPAGASVSADVAGVPSGVWNYTWVVPVGDSTLDYLVRIEDAVDTEVAAIKAKTDNLPAAPAAAGDCITAAGVRTAVGLASANLDTQLGDLPTNAELATALGTADDATLAAIAALNNLSAAQVTAAVPTAAQNAAALLAAGDVDGYSLEETLKICLAALAGKLSGAATATVVIRAADDSKARITATCDSSGNRSAITLDETG